MYKAFNLFYFQIVNPVFMRFDFFLEKNFFVAKGQKKLVYLEWKNVQ